MKVSKNTPKDWAILSLSVGLLFISIAASVAWMILGKTYEQPLWMFQYGDKNRIYVEKTDLEVSFYLRDEITKEYVKIPPQADEEGVLQPLVTMEGMMPSQGIYFKLELTNKSEINSKVNILFSGIHAEKVKEEEKTPIMEDALFLVLTKSEGYTGDYAPYVPVPFYECVGDITTYTEGQDGSLTGTMSFSEELTIPQNSTINLYGYLLFDKDADSRYENCDYIIDSIYILG